MTLIYSPSIAVQPYKIFGVTMFAVECTSFNYQTIKVCRIQLGWFFDAWSSSKYAEELRKGDKP